MAAKTLLEECKEIRHTFYLNLTIFSRQDCDSFSCDEMIPVKSQVLHFRNGIGEQN